jgi:uncharacterized membrane protein (UPF0127 family)
VERDTVLDDNSAVAATASELSASVAVEAQGRRGRSLFGLLGRSRARGPRLKGVVLVGPSGQIVCERCYVADRSLPRLRGLIGWRTLEEGEGMLLRPSWSIHTSFVRFPIDVAFLDEGLTILALRRLRPWRAAWEKGAHSVLELPAGQCERLGLEVGDRLGWGWL